MDTYLCVPFARGKLVCHRGCDEVSRLFIDLFGELKKMSLILNENNHVISLSLASGDVSGCPSSIILPINSNEFTLELNVTSTRHKMDIIRSRSSRVQNIYIFQQTNVADRTGAPPPNRRRRPRKEWYNRWICKHCYSARLLGPSTQGASPRPLYDSSANRHCSEKPWKLDFHDLPTLHTFPDTRIAN